MENNKDTSVRVDRQTKDYLDKIAEKEGLSVKECLMQMSVFFIKNRIGLKDEVVSSVKRIEDVIRILRSMEKNYFEPIDREVRTIRRFTEDIILDTPQTSGSSDETYSEEEVNIPQINSFSQRNEELSDNTWEVKKLKKCNDNLIETLNILISPDKMTVKTGVGGSKSYILKLSPQEIDDIKRTIEICTIQ